MTTSRRLAPLPLLLIGLLTLLALAGGLFAIVQPAQAQTAPTISSVEFTSDPGADGAYIAGDHIEATVTFSEAVTVTGTPELTIRLGFRQRTALYNRGSGTTMLVFRYTVKAGADSSFGNSINIRSDNLELAGGTIKAGTTNAVLTHDAVATTNQIVDTDVPYANSSAIRPGAASVIELIFTEALDATSVPAAAAFTATVAGAARQVTEARIAYGYYGGVNTDVQLTLASDVRTGETVKVSYTPPATNRLQDVPGNQVAAFTDFEIHNLLPNTAPAKITTFTAEAGAGSVTLRWDPPHNGGSTLSDFVYEERPTRPAEFWVNVPDSRPGEANETSYTITDLSPGFPYTYRILAQNGVGFGPPSDPIVAIPYGPPGSPHAPRDVVASGRNQSVILSWTIGPDGGSPITKHRYGISSANEPPTLVEIPNSAPGEANDNSVTVTGLTNGVAYHFGVMAMNEHGWGPSSTHSTQGQHIGTPQVTYPPGAPGSPSLSSGDGKVILQWLPPSSDGGLPIERYEYRFDAADFGNSWIPIPDSAPGGANHGRYEIARQNGQYAIVYLRAVNEQGAGAEVQRQAMPFAGAPGPPRDFKATLISENVEEDEFVLSWTEPVPGPGVTITGYIIDRSPDGVTEWGQRTYNIEVPGPTSFTGRLGVLEVSRNEFVRHSGYFRIRTQFQVNTPTVVDGTEFSWGMSETSPVVGIDTGRIPGNPRLPRFRVADTYAREGVDEFMDFTVRLVPASLYPNPYTTLTTVDYRTQDITATQPGDYRRTNGTLIFEQGETEKTVSVRIFDDNVEDSGEVFALLLSDPAGARLGDEGAFGVIYNDEDVVAGFTLVDAASGTDVGSLADGTEITLADPANGRYGIVAQAAPEIGSVRLELTGAKVVPHTDNAAPYSLYGDTDGTVQGEALPVGSYTLSGTAYTEADGGGEALGTLTVSFTVTAGDTTATTGLPLISGTARVGETLTADTSAISDEDGLSNVSYQYQWLRDDADIAGQTNSTYRLVSADQDKTIKVRVTFRDDADNQESLTSAATTAVAAQPAETPAVLLTASFANVPADHNGSNFTFQLSFSENVEAGYARIRDDAFTLSGGAIASASRITQGSNQGWNVEVNPTGNGSVTITLPETTDCDASGAICTDDSRKLSHPTSATVAGPPAISVSDATVQEAEGAALVFTATLSHASSRTVTVDYATSDGTAVAGSDYSAASGTLTFNAGDTSQTVHVTVLTDSEDESQETLTLTISNPSQATLDDGTGTGTIENGKSSSGTQEDPPAVSLTATFANMPATHNGSAFTFDLTFSEEFGISYVTLRDDAFNVTGGEVTSARRLTQGSNIGWTITVTPDSAADVTIVLPVTTDCDDEGAVCTADGRKLSNRLEFTVSGPGG